MTTDETIKDLQRQLALKQLQVNRLLDITQAINNNLKATDLFQMYRAFLNWELDVKRLALFVRNEHDWECRVQMNTDEALATDPSTLPFLTGFHRVAKLEGGDLLPFFQQFDVIIPVAHKDMPIAYALIGGHDRGDFSKVQLIIMLTNIVAVAIENKRLAKQQLQQERLNYELTLASEMQRTLVPDRFPVSPHFELSSIYMPHLGVGGDYFDCIHSRPNRYLFCVADISGKGLAAALLMANFQAILRTLVRKSTTAEGFIQELNEAVLDITKGEKYLTFFVAEYNIRTKLLRYINAGHVPPILMLDGEKHLLSKGCTIIGFFEAMPKAVEIGEIVINGPATLMIYTDGITDVRNSEGAFFSDEALFQFIEQHHQLPAKDMNQQLLQTLHTFRGEEEFPDDITVLTCQFGR